VTSSDLEMHGLPTYKSIATLLYCYGYGYYYYYYCYYYYYYYYYY